MGRHKFEVGETVLCFEPDPENARVLYQSKVKQIFHKTDGRGQPHDEYLIHFDKWNSAWDACLTEDYLLKDTPRNRNLKEYLASLANLTPSHGHNLYKRGMQSLPSIKPSCSSTISDVSDMHYDTNNSCQDDSEVEDFEVYANDALRSIPEICIPNALKKALGHDYYLIKERKWLPKLPAEPNIVTILDSWVRHFANDNIYAFICRQTRRIDYEDLSSRIAICKEVADGLRIMFDFTAEGTLLCEEEKPQFYQAREDIDYTYFSNDNKRDSSVDLAEKSKTPKRKWELEEPLSSECEIKVETTNSENNEIQIRNPIALKIKRVRLENGETSMTVVSNDVPTTHIGRGGKNFYEIIDSTSCNPPEVCEEWTVKSSPDHIKLVLTKKNLKNSSTYIPDQFNSVDQPVVNSMAEKLSAINSNNCGNSFDNDILVRDYFLENPVNGNSVTNNPFPSVTDNYFRCKKRPTIKYLTMFKVVVRKKMKNRILQYCRKKEIRKKNIPSDIKKLIRKKIEAEYALKLNRKDFNIRLSKYRLKGIKSFLRKYEKNKSKFTAKRANNIDAKPKIEPGRRDDRINHAEKIITPEKLTRGKTREMATAPSLNLAPDSNGKVDIGLILDSSGLRYDDISQSKTSTRRKNREMATKPTLNSLAYLNYEVDCGLILDYQGPRYDDINQSEKLTRRKTREMATKSASNSVDYLNHEVDNGLILDYQHFDDINHSEKLTRRKTREMAIMSARNSVANLPHEVVGSFILNRAHHDDMHQSERLTRGKTLGTRFDDINQCEKLTRSKTKEMAITPNRNSVAYLNHEGDCAMILDNTGTHYDDIVQSEKVLTPEKLTRSKTREMATVPSSNQVANPNHEVDCSLIPDTHYHNVNQSEKLTRSKTRGMSTTPCLNPFANPNHEVNCGLIPVTLYHDVSQSEKLTRSKTKEMETVPFANTGAYPNHEMHCNLISDNPETRHDDINQSEKLTHGKTKALAVMPARNPLATFHRNEVDPSLILDTCRRSMKRKSFPSECEKESDEKVRILDVKNVSENNIHSIETRSFSRNGFLHTSIENVRSTPRNHSDNKCVVAEEKYEGHFLRRKINNNGSIENCLKENLDDYANNRRYKIKNKPNNVDHSSEEKSLTANVIPTIPTRCSSRLRDAAAINEVTKNQIPEKAKFVANETASKIKECSDIVKIKKSRQKSTYPQSAKRIKIKKLKSTATIRCGVPVKLLRQWRKCKRLKFNIRNRLKLFRKRIHHNRNYIEKESHSVNVKMEPRPVDYNKTEPKVKNKKKKKAKRTKNYKQNGSLLCDAIVKIEPTDIDEIDKLNDEPNEEVNNCEVIMESKSLKKNSSKLKRFRSSTMDGGTNKLTGNKKFAGAPGNSQSSAFGKRYGLRHRGAELAYLYMAKIAILELNDWTLVPEWLFMRRPLNPSFIYGPVHLLRMFLQLPEMFKYSWHSMGSIDLIYEYLESFLKFLVDHEEWFDHSHYIKNY